MMAGGSSCSYEVRPRASECLKPIRVLEAEKIEVWHSNGVKHSDAQPVVRGLVRDLHVVRMALLAPGGSHRMKRDPVRNDSSVAAPA